MQNKIVPLFSHFVSKLIHTPKVSKVLGFQFEVLSTETESTLIIVLDRVSREAQDKEPLKTGHLDTSPSFLTGLCMTDSTHREFSVKSLCVLAKGLNGAWVLLKDVNTDKSFYVTTLPFEKLNTRLCPPHHASVSNTY